MDNKYGAPWHVIVGVDFGSFVSFDRRSFLLFQIADMQVLIFKHGTVK